MDSFKIYLIINSLIIILYYYQQYKLNKKKIYFSFLIFHFFMNVISLLIKQDLNYFNLITNLVVIVIYLYLINQELYLDQLTKSYNRKFLETKIYNKMLSKKELLGIFLFDIDKFKSINDAYGHHIGDQVLINFVNILKNNVSKKDYIIRIGGDEFLLLTKIKKVTDLKLRKKEIMNKFQEYNKIAKIPINISVGTEIYQKKDNFDILFKKMDKKLYIDKQMNNKNNNK